MVNVLPKSGLECAPAAARRLYPVEFHRCEHRAPDHCRVPAKTPLTSPGTDRRTRRELHGGQDLVQLVPFQCRIRVLWMPPPEKDPTAHAARGDRALTALRAAPPAGERLATTAHLVPFQCSTNVLDASDLVR